MNAFVILLLASLSLAAPPKQPAKLKSIEELGALCKSMEAEANRVVAPLPPKSCGSFFGGSLTASREELKQEFQGNGGVVHYCRELHDKLQALRKYRHDVQMKCQTAGFASAQASASAKGNAQNKFVDTAGSSRSEISRQQAGCAGEIAPVLPESSADYHIQAGVVPEPAPAHPPKDTYPKIGKSVVRRQTQFIENTAKNGGAASYEDEKDSCGAIAGNYLNLAKATRMSFDQMSELVAAERDHAVSELESYRRAAAKFGGSGAAMKQTADKLGNQPKPLPQFNPGDE